MVTSGMCSDLSLVDLDRLGEGELADPGAGERCDRISERRSDRGDADLPDSGRRLGRLDQGPLDLRDRAHPHDRIGVEVLGDDVAAIAEDDLAPRRGADSPEQSPFHLRTDEIWVDVSPT